jgi:hypothetical protein
MLRVLEGCASATRFALAVRCAFVAVYVSSEELPIRGGTLAVLTCIFVPCCGTIVAEMIAAERMGEHA